MKAALKAKTKAASRKRHRNYPTAIRPRSSPELKVEFNTRFATEVEYEHVKKAAASLDPPQSLNLFVVTAALKESDRVLGYPLPTPA